MLQSSTFIVRIYSADLSRSRILSPGQIGNDATWRIVAQGGYEQAQVLLYGKPADFPDIRRGRRIEMSYLYQLPSGNGEIEVLLYRGKVRRRKFKRELIGNQPVPTGRITLYGIWSDIVKGQAEKRYAIQGGQDRAWFFGDLMSNFVLPRIPGLAVDNQEIGDRLSFFDAYKVGISSAVESLAQNVGRTVFGGDVGSDVDGRPDRAYFRPVDPVEVVKHTLVVPSPHVGVRQYDEDTTRQASRLRIKGGPLQYPNRLAELTQGNTSFETPTLPDGSNGNLLSNPSFEVENLITSFAFGWERDGTGPFYTDGGTGYGSADTGTKIIVLDDLGDLVRQLREPDIALIEDHVYALNVRGHQHGAGSPSEMVVTLSYRDGSDNLLETSGPIPFTPADFERFGDHKVYLKCPSGAVKYEASAELSDDNGASIVIDSLSLYDTTVVQQQGWQLDLEGTAAVNAVDWTYTERRRSGAYSLFIDCASAGGVGSGNNPILRPRARAKMPYEGGTPLRLKCWVHSPPGGGAYPEITLQILFYKEGSLQITDSFTTFPGDASPLTDWTLRKVEDTGPNDADEVSFLIGIDSAGQILFDDVAIEHQAATDTEWYEGDRYERVFHALDLFADGTPVHEEAEAIEAEGGLEVTEEREEINNDTDGATYSTAYFAQNTLPLQRPDLDAFGVVETGAGLTTAQMWPGQNVRLIGGDAGDLLPDGPLPIAEVEGRWDGTKLTLKPYLRAEKEDAARVIRELIRRSA